MHCQVPLPSASCTCHLKQPCCATFFHYARSLIAYKLTHVVDEWKFTSSDHTKYCVLPCVRSSAPSLFQFLINDMPRDMLGKYVVAYIDRIMVYSLSYVFHVSQVLT